MFTWSAGATKRRKGSGSSLHLPLRGSCSHEQAREKPLVNERSVRLVWLWECHGEVRLFLAEQLVSDTRAMANN